MNLSFTQQIKGIDNFFLQKIWTGLIRNRIASFTEHDQFKHAAKLKGVSWPQNANLSKILLPKIHTIRNGTRWKPGMIIHFCIGLRTKNYFRFAPLLPVKSVQLIRMEWIETPILKIIVPAVYIDGKEFYHSFADNQEKQIKDIEELAINDGFESAKDFFKYFEPKYITDSVVVEMQLIHWTDKTY